MTEAILPKILVVDDNRANLQAMKRLFKASGIPAECVLAASGNEALALVLEHEFALLLLDVDMPEMDGYEVAEMLKSVEQTKNLPIIFVTAAYKDHAHQLKGYDVGAIDYLEKPLDDTILLSKVRVFLTLYNSIAERKRAEEELRQYKRCLEEEVQQRTSDLLLARNAAEAANRAKSQFLANMSHELRTPLNAILGFSEMLGRDSTLSEAQQETLAIIHKSGDHLLRLINDILEITKIEAGRIVLEPLPFDFGGMIAELIDMLRPRAQDKGLQLLVEESSGFPRYLVGDETKLRQILINLISNAIKATEQGSVKLRLGVEHNPCDHLVMEVEDTGGGIAPADQSRIFTTFVQVDSQGKQQGTGLGLTITRQFVELMGGSISLSSTVGQGSTFRVEIPVQPARPEDVPQAPAVRGEVSGLESGQPPYRILVVDDQPENQLLLVRLLENVGFAVRHAQNGAEAVEQFTSWNPHFIWMDRRMPVMDGMDATRRIRALPGGEAVKIATVTASTFKEEDAEMTAAGFDDIVHKPFRTGQIFASMERLLGVKFLRAEVKVKAAPQSLTALAALPETLRAELADAIDMLDAERIAEIIGRVVEVEPDLGKALAHYASRYNYAGILQALDARAG